MQHPAKFQPTLQRRITSSILRNNNDSSKRWRHTMSNEMFKTVILNVFYVMHILKLTFILNFALIGQYILTNRILQWESVMYISSSTICCFAYFNLSRLKLSVTTWPLNLSKRPKMTTSCSRAPSGDHFEEIGHFLGCSIISDFGGLETIKIRWAENPEKSIRLQVNLAQTWWVIIYDSSKRKSQNIWV